MERDRKGENDSKRDTHTLKRTKQDKHKKEWNIQIAYELLSFTAKCNTRRVLSPLWSNRPDS